MKFQTLVFVALLAGLAAAQLTPNVLPLPLNIAQAGTVYPCGVDYYRTTLFNDVDPGDYIVFQLNETTLGDDTTMYIGVDSNPSSDADLPSESFFIQSCPGQCTITLSCDFANGFAYYVAVFGGLNQDISYNLTVFRNSVPITAVPIGQDFVVLNQSNPVPTVQPYDYPQNYKHYSVVIPTTFDPVGTYFSVQISDVYTNVTGVFPTLYLNDNGVATTQDDCILDTCLTYVNGFPDNTNLQSCDCTVADEDDECNVTLSPCFTQLGVPYYFSVEIPTIVPVEFSYTLLVTVFTTRIVNLTANQPYYLGYSELQSPAHFRLTVNPNQITAGETRLRVKIDSVVGGTAELYVNQNTITGDLQGCAGSIATCTTEWACNVVLEKCYFSPIASLTTTYWYFAVETITPDPDRTDLPDGLITFTITAFLEQDKATQEIDVDTLAPIADTVSEASYNFYVLDVPDSVDTWLFVELYANQNDTEVILYMLHGAKPGALCYAEPDFYCLTGSDGRESCQFALQPCELRSGPLYFAVYGQYQDTAYGDNTFYDYPVHYTLYADFEVAAQVINKVSYSEHVYEGHYQHYYIVARDVKLGQYMDVDISNIQGGQINGFVNKNYMAGDCPCFENQFNCTGDVAWPDCSDDDPDNGNTKRLPSLPGGIPAFTGDFCTITVGSCDFGDGVWYISVYGVDYDPSNINAIGYTLTVTIYDAPKINTLALGEYQTGEVAQDEYDHYKLIATPRDNANLVVEIVYVTGHEDDNTLDTDNVRIYLGKETLATDECYIDYCDATKAGNESYSYCTIILPACQWEKGQYYVSVLGEQDSPENDNIRYTLRAYVEEEPVTQLTSGTAYFGANAESRYSHYYIDVRKTTTNYLFVEFYINSDQGPPQDVAADYVVNYTAVLYLNIDELAGGEPCHDYIDYYECNTTNSCYWMIENCDLVSGRYYFAIFAEQHQWYDVAVEYTFRVTEETVPTTLVPGQPVMGYIWDTMQDHWSLDVTPQLIAGYRDLTFSIANVKHGSVRVTARRGDRSGSCPCYEYSYICDADDDAGSGTPNYCLFTIPYCLLVNNTGIWYINVQGTENYPDGAGLYTPIGYTIEAILPVPIVTQPATLGATYLNEELPIDTYHHYAFTVPATAVGSVIRVNFSDVEDGSITAFLTLGPNPSNETCGGFNVCNGGVCIIDAPICTLFNYNGPVWLSVLGNPTNENVTYNLTVSVIPPTALTTTPVEYEPTDYLHQFYVINNLAQTPGQQLQIRLDNVSAGNVRVYVNQGAPAWPRSLGDAQCCADTIEILETSFLCTGDEYTPNNCDYTVPTCAWSAGNIFVTVYIDASSPGGDADYYISYGLVDTLGTPTTLTSGVETATQTLNGVGQFQAFTIAVSGVNPDSDNTRLVVQTTFLSGTEGTVYILPNAPANPGSCSTYSCSNSGGNTCNSATKYVNETCCLENGNYNILVQQTGPGSLDFRVEATIYSQQAVSVLTTDNTPIDNSANGVPGETVTNFQITLSAAQLANTESLIINVTDINGALNLYFRRGFPAGSFSAQDGCYAFDQQVNCGGECSLYIPGCDLAPGTYYVGLYNPAFDTISNYTIAAQLRGVASLGTFDVNSPVSVANTIWGAGTYDHYFVDIPSSAVARNLATQFNLTRVNGGNIELAISSIGLAGDEAGDCLTDNIYDQTDCTDTCLFSIALCNGWAPGRYYLSVYLDGGDFADYELSVSTLSTPYQVLNPFGIVGTPDFGWSVVNITNATQYYTFNTNAAGVSSSDLSNLIVNVTQLDLGPGTLTVTLTDDVCRTYQCSANAPGGSCIISDDELDPCSFAANSGQYYMIIQNPSAVNFTATAILRNPNITTLTTDGAEFTNQIFVGRWYHYLIPAPEATVGYGASLEIDITASCGAITAYITEDSVSGPNCDIKSCSTDPTSPSDPTDSCSITLDPCELDWANYYLAVFVESQQFTSTNLYIGAKYVSEATLTPYDFTEIPLYCPSPFQGSDLIVQQLYVDVETANIGAYMYFELVLPDDVDDNDWIGGGFTVVRNSSVGDSSDCQVLASCVFDGVTYTDTCSDFVSPCEFDRNHGKLFVELIAPFNATFQPILIQPDIPVAEIDQTYSATVQEGQYVYYTFDVDPDQENLVITVLVSEIDNGDLTVYLRNGLEPLGNTYHYGTDSSCFNATCDESSYRVINGRNACEIVVQPCVDVWAPWFITIEGTDQYCLNTSIAFDVLVTTTVDVDTLDVPDVFCDEVFEQTYHYYHFSPAASTPTNILEVTISDVAPGEQVSLYLWDTEVATSSCSLESCTTNSQGECQITYECAYTDLYASVFGDVADNEEIAIQYRIRTNFTTINPTVLTESVPVTVSAPDCTGQVDYYRINVPQGTDPNTSYLDIILTQVFPDAPNPSTMYVAYNHIPDLDVSDCVDATCTTAAGNGDNATDCHVYRISCDLAVGSYFVAVEASEPYSIVYELYSPAPTALTLGTASAVQSLDVEGYLFFSVDVPAAQATPDNYLAVTIDGFNYGDVVVRVNYGALPDDDDSTAACSINSTDLTYSNNQPLWTVLEVNQCQLTSGTYYIGVFGASRDSCPFITFTVTASIGSRPVNLTQLTNDVPLTSQSISGNVINHYQFNQVATNQNTFLHVRLWDVQGGHLRINANPYRYAIPDDGTSLELPCVVDSCDVDNDAGEVSCAFYVDRCDYVPHTAGSPWFLSVEVLDQDFDFVPVTYTVLVSEETFTAISQNANTPSSGTFANDDWAFDFYSLDIQDTVSLTLHFDITGGDEGVYVQVYDSPCDYDAFYRQNFFCSRRYTDTPNWLCELEISTREQFPDAENYYIYVYGKNASYTGYATLGRAGNCREPDQTGADAELSFCAGRVEYNTWIWSNFTVQDYQAQCLYEDLKEQFFCTDCFCGITEECDNALRDFACFDVFPRCDADGFQSPTCRVACDAVVYYCANYFDSVNLEALNCTAPFYVDDPDDRTCTGDNVVINVERTSRDDESGAFNPQSTLFALLFSALAIFIRRFL